MRIRFWGRLLNLFGSDCTFVCLRASVHECFRDFLMHCFVIYANLILGVACGMIQ